MVGVRVTVEVGGVKAISVAFALVEIIDNLVAVRLGVRVNVGVRVSVIVRVIVLVGVRVTVGVLVNVIVGVMEGRMGTPGMDMGVELAFRVGRTKASFGSGVQVAGI
jgi:hypothetical protein